MDDFVLKGVAECRIRSTGPSNYHFVASIPKMVLACMVTSMGELGLNVVNLHDDWLGSIPGDGPTVAVSVYHDDFVTEALVTTLAANKIPLLAVISADPERDYFSGGISYIYDPITRVYQGRSRGRESVFCYRASPYAKYWSVEGATVAMRTLALAASERLVLFYPSDVSTK